MSRLFSFFHRRKNDRELDDEFQFHLQRQREEFIAKGMTPEEARYAAMRKLGNIVQHMEQCRDIRGWNLFEELIQDVCYAGRSLRRTPGFTAIAVLTLALGIGANTTIFTLLEGIVFSPLPYREPDRLVVVFLNNLTMRHLTLTSYPDFLDWQRNARSFQQISGMLWHEDFDLTGPGTPEHIDGKEISSGFFNTLGTNLLLGREFSEEEDRYGGARAAVISSRMWRDRFDGSRTVLGKSVTLNGVDYTIVGVAPPGFRLEGDADVYIPLAQADQVRISNRTIHQIYAVARLAPGTNIAQAETEMNAIQSRLDDLYPGADRGQATEIRPLQQAVVGDVRRPLLLLLAAVGMVLLIACANVANLLLARSAVRRREFAIRSALGARRARIARQLVAESVILSLAGGGLGLLVAEWGLKLVLAVVPEGVPRIDNIHLNVPVLLFVFCVSVIVGVVFGLLPALKASNIDLQGAMKAGDRGSTNPLLRAQNTFVIIQVALTLVLLAGTGLLFRTIRQLWRVNPGFEPQHVITFKVELSPALTKTPAKMRTAYQELIDRIHQVPGIQATDITTLIPLSRRDNPVPFWVDSQQPASVAEARRMTTYSTGPDYLKVMGIPLLRGRFFSSEDTVTSPPVIVIDSTFADTYFPNKDPIGQTIRVPSTGAYTIIGVIGHVKQHELGNEATLVQAYSSFYQISDRWLPTMHGDATLMVRTPLDMAAIMSAIKDAIREMATDQSVYDVDVMQQMVSESMSSQRFPMILLGTFAGLALLLASVGIYGVVSYSVAQRSHEIGIRVAVGASKREIFKLVIGRSLRLGAAGVAIGMVLSAVATRAIAGLLYGVSPVDPITFAVIGLLLTAVAVLAAYVPALSACRVDPMVTLRDE